MQKKLERQIDVKGKVSKKRHVPNQIEHLMKKRESKVENFDADGQKDGLTSKDYIARNGSF